MLEKFGGDAPHIFGLLGSPMTARALAATPGRRGARRAPAGCIETARLLASSPREFLERNFESPEIRATLAAWGMHLDFPPDIVGRRALPLSRKHGRTRALAW